MRRRSDGTTIRVGNPLLACAYSAVALGSEAAVIVGVLHANAPLALTGAVVLVGTVAGAVRHPELLLRTVAVPTAGSAAGPATATD